MCVGVYVYVFTCSYACVWVCMCWCIHPVLLCLWVGLYRDPYNGSHRWTLHMCFRSLLRTKKRAPCPCFRKDVKQYLPVEYGGILVMLWSYGGLDAALYKSSMWWNRLSWVPQYLHIAHTHAQTHMLAHTYKHILTHTQTHTHKHTHKHIIPDWVAN